MTGGDEIGFGYRNLRPGRRTRRERLGHWDGHTDPGSQEPCAFVSTPPCVPRAACEGQAVSGGMVRVAYARPVCPAAALRDSVL